MKVHVEVTQEDIDKGALCDGLYCPVARAVGRAIPGAMADVDAGTISIFLCGRWVYADSPPSVFEFVFDFDNQKPVQPFSFDLEIPDELCSIDS